MKKRIVVFAMCLFLAVGCASWQKMSTSEKLDLVGNYYSAFLNGLKLAAPIVSTDPKVAIALQIGDVALSTYKTVVDAYKAAEVGPDTVALADATLHSAVVEANSAVGSELTK